VSVSQIRSFFGDAPYDGVDSEGEGEGGGDAAPAMVPDKLIKTQ